MKSFLIVGHADGDGHLVAEQTRRNISNLQAAEVSVFVDQEKTKGHQSWRFLDSIEMIHDAEFIVFVDMMFSPADFVTESNAVVAFAENHPNKTIFIIDHHPLPINRLYKAKNIRPVYRPNVIECCVGPISGLMLLAAINERQFTTINGLYTSEHEILERGIRRAAAPGGILPGERLLALLRHDCWAALYALGCDEAESHKLVRGRRSRVAPKSELLLTIEKIADSLINDLGAEQEFGQLDAGKINMPAFELELKRYSIADSENNPFTNVPVVSKDLEALVTLLELAAISLTESPAATFSFDELLSEAQSIAGDELDIDRNDVSTVIGKARFVKSVAKNTFRLR